MPGLSVSQVRLVFLRIADQMIKSQDVLTEADRAIGDGDHGTGIARGFEAVRKKLEQSTPADLAELLRLVGRELMMTIGGAAGIIFGTLFQAGGKRLAGVQVLDSQSLYTLLADGLVGVQERGKARAGDKTLVDVLIPAVEKAADMRDYDLDEALQAICRAAFEGMESTKDMVAHFGKAKTLGERAVGYPDPGAISTYLIIKTMAEEAKTVLDDSSPESYEDPLPPTHS